MGSSEPIFNPILINHMPLNMKIFLGFLMMVACSASWAESSVECRITSSDEAITTNFLPEAFRTETTQKFLNATLDQLVTQPDLRNINGYVGRKFAPTFKSTDNYISEITGNRQNYQLEPSVVVKNKITKILKDLIDGNKFVLCFHNSNNILILLEVLSKIA